VVEGGRKEKLSAALARTRPVFRGLRRFLDRPDLFWEILLARTRPVFRGLRPEESVISTITVSILARTRPVFRGLRHGLQNRHPSTGRQWQSCKDETRFQGIATPLRQSARPAWLILLLARTRPVFRGLRPSLPLWGGWQSTKLARTRPVFRGLRRLIPARRQKRVLPKLLARTRPVFRGLRRICIPPQWSLDTSGLQGRDPFSGDCDPPDLEGVRQPDGQLLARTRPVFRGLRHLSKPDDRWEIAHAACKDETRFQGMATARRGGR
jgi:hypothetical protein